MKRKGTGRLLVIATVVLSLVGVFLLGLLLGFRLSGTTASPLSDRARQRVDAAEAALTIEKLTGRRANLDETDVFAAQAIEALEGLGAVSRKSERTYRAQVIARALPLAELVKVVEGVAAQARTPAHADAMAALLDRWGEMDPRSAMAYATGGKAGLDRETAVLAVLSGWARSSPEAALAWAREQSGGPQLTASRAGTVVLEAARKNPELAFDMAVGLPDGPVRTRALEAFFYHLLNQVEPRRATNWLVDVPDGESLRSVNAYIAGEWARYSPEQAALWAAGLSEESGRHTAVERAATSWAQEDPRQAAQWIASLPEGTTRREAAEALAQGWLARGDASALAHWLNEQPPHPDFDLAIRALALDAARYDGQTGFSWAMAISDIQERTLTGTIIGQEWMNDAPAAARTVIAAAPISDEAKMFLIGSMQVVAAQPQPTPPPPQPQSPPVITGANPPPAQEQPVELEEEDVWEDDPYAEFDENGELYPAEEEIPMYEDYVQ